MGKSFDLEAEVRDLCARRDINKALCRYMRGQDRLDADLHRSAFHDDAWVDCGLMNGSADEFVSFAQGFLKDLAGSQHIMGQVDLDVQGDHASGEVYFYAWHRINENDEGEDLIVAGRYIDEYANKNGDWRIVKRKEVIDWARTDDAADEFLEINDFLPRGQTGKGDFSYTRNWPK